MRSTNTFYIVVLWTATANIAKRGQIFGQVLEKQKPTQMDKGPVDRIIDDDIFILCKIALFLRKVKYST